ncbi:MAG: glycoside hydrolase [Cellulomonas sp.]|nr:glycoside hydrolase [Cellulomonas sp.]
MNRRRGAIAAGLTAVAVLVTGIALIRPAGEEPTVPGSPAAPGWRPVSVDDALVPAAERMADIALVPFAPDRPGVAAGRLVRPGSAGELTIWQVQEPGRWSGAQLGVPEPVTSIVMAGDDGLVAVAGSTWQDGAAGTYLVTSSDRSTWHRVVLPPEAERIDLTAATVTGGGVYLLGTVRGTQSGRLVVVHDDQVTIHELPAVAGAEELATLGVAGDGTRLLVTQRTRSGDAWSNSVIRSDDDGLTWSAPQPVDSEPVASVSALVRAADGWLAVGSVPSPSDPTLWVPQAWSSSDGTVWARDQVDPPEGGWSQDDSQWFSSLATRDGAAAAAVLHGGSTRTSVYSRADGRWSLVTISDPFTDLEPSAQVTITPGLDYWVVRQGDRSGGVWEYLAAQPGWARIDSAESTDPVVRTVTGIGPGSIAAVRPMIETSTTGWRTWSEPGRFVLDDQGLRQVDWPSTLLDEVSAVFAARRPGADDVLYVGYGWKDTLDGLRLTGVLDRTDGTASSVGGIATGVAPRVTGVLGTQDEWVVVGARRADVGPSSDDEPVLWTSDDAVSWDEDGPDELGVPGRTGVVRGACTMPDGSMIAVGWSGTTGRTETSARVWYPHGDSWSVATPVAGDGWFSGCTSTPAGVVLTGTIGDDNLWFSADGTTLTAVDPAPQSTIGTPVALGADGEDSPDPAEVRWLVAVGSVSEEDYQGPVLWVSRDGRQWDWMRIPSRSPAASGAVVPAAGGPLVVIEAEGGIQAWQLTDAQDTFTALTASPTASGSPSGPLSTAFVP